VKTLQALLWHRKSEYDFTRRPSGSQAAYGRHYNPGRVNGVKSKKPKTPIFIQDKRKNVATRSPLQEIHANKPENNEVVKSRNSPCFVIPAKDFGELSRVAGIQSFP
jgi:hypothetical protein